MLSDDDFEDDFELFFACTSELFESCDTQDVDVDELTPCTIKNSLFWLQLKKATV